MTRNTHGRQRHRTFPPCPDGSTPRGPILIVLMATLAFLAGVVGCGGDRSPVREKDLAPSYAEVLTRWTASAKVYQNLVSMAQVTATLKSTDFRRAYARKYAEDFQLSPGDAAKLLADQTAAAVDDIEFFLAISGSREQEMDLDTKDSPWRIYLETPGLARLEPFEVRRLKKKTIRLEGFYPYVSQWTEIYQVRFRPAGRPIQQGELDLVVTGVLGTARLVYRLDDRSPGK